MSNPQLHPKLQGVVDTLLTDIRRKLVEDGELPATMFLFGDRLVVYELNTELEYAKDVDAARLRELARENHAEAAILAGEGWTLPDHLLDQRPAIVAKYGSVSACPDRIEVVFLGVETSTMGHWLVEAPLVRAGRAVTMGTLRVHAMQAHQRVGRFHHILPTENP